MTTPTESVSFVILGSPVPKGRPRFVRYAQGMRAVTPKRTREYEALVRQVAALHCGHWRRDGLYRVTLTFFGERELRGDLDNYCKAQLDGMQGAAFDNDRQVSEVVARKTVASPQTRESTRAGVPRTEVLVERIGDWPVRRRRRG